MNKKYIKIHIWFVINLAAISFLFYGGSFSSLSFLVIYASSLLVIKWREIKIEFTAPMTKRNYFIEFGIVLLIIIILFISGIFNTPFPNPPLVSRIAFLGLLCIYLVAYIILLRRKKNENVS